MKKLIELHTLNVSTVRNLKKFLHQKLGGSEMNSSNQDDVKLVFHPGDEEDIVENYLAESHYSNSYSSFLTANNRVTDRARIYMSRYGESDDWFMQHSLDHDTHRNLAFPLRVFDIAMARPWTHNKDKYRDYQCNLLIDKFNNALTLEMKVSAGRASIHNFMRQKNAAKNVWYD